MAIVWFCLLILGMISVYLVFAWVRAMREARRCQRILDKHFNYLQSPEYKRLNEETLQAMQNDDLYKSDH